MLSTFACYGRGKLRTISDKHYGFTENEISSFTTDVPPAE